MMDIKWTKELSVGNEVIDSEHMNLIGLTNGVVHAILKRDCAALAQAFEMLEDRLHAHFVNEEKIALAAEFDYSKHKQAQLYSLRELRHMRDELLAKNCVWGDGTVDHFTRSLRNWMIDGHIVKLDMQMKPALLSRPCDFKNIADQK
ncbi:MAG: hemerythrin domain-containing protein [Gallionella sp.]|nr:hemerythrin domain-containing protein [Gallionella sp.]